MKKVTVQDVMAFDPCYSEEELLELWGDRESISLQEYKDLDVSAADRLWGMTRLWPEFLEEWHEAVIEIGLRHALKRHRIKDLEWAEKWLSGEDRISKPNPGNGVIEYRVFHGSSWMTAVDVSYVFPNVYEIREKFVQMYDSLRESGNYS